MSSSRSSAAGYVVVARKRLKDGKSAALVLEAHNHHTWLPPKGCCEGTEDFITTARRELVEEVGAEFASGLTFKEEHMWSEEYIAFGKPKRAVYFLAVCETDGLNVTLSPEHVAYRWVTPEEFRSLEPRLAAFAKILEEAINIANGAPAVK